MTPFAPSPYPPGLSAAGLSRNSRRLGLDLAKSSRQSCNFGQVSAEAFCKPGSGFWIVPHRLSEPSCGVQMGELPFDDRCVGLHGLRVPAAPVRSSQ